MFINARTVEPESHMECDVCVVGAGGAGITVACELAGTGLTVFLVESGGFDFDRASQDLYKARSVGLPYPDLQRSRLRFFGGTTNTWEGNCSPLDPIDFEKRAEIEHSGWPFDRQHLDPFYERAISYCQLDRESFELDYWSKLLNRNPFPLDPARVVTKIKQTSPVHFGAAYREDLKSAENTTVLLHANLVNIETSPDGNLVNKVHIGVLEGPRFSIGLRYLVLAMGGIENARILLTSNGVHANGIGNQNDLVGRFFMEHSMMEGGAIFFGESRPDLSLYLNQPPAEEHYGSYLSVAEQALREEGLTNIRAPFRPVTRYYLSDGIDSSHQVLDDLERGDFPDDLDVHVANIVKDFDMVLEGVSRKAFGRSIDDSSDDHYGYVFDTMVELTPNPDSRVTLTEERDALGTPRVRLDWRACNRDHENLWRCYEIIGEEIGRAGLGRVRVFREREDRIWADQMGRPYHHMGTTRAHRNPKNGVVNEHMQVHGVPNLFLAGSSVFPTGGHVPPTFTIVALAIRLADHMKSLTG
ncbi:MAG: GMC family oxidoreductase [Thermoanaerobaculia bacterium]